ncbi:cellulose biosynthesis protein BcsC [Novosphingobium sp.]|uniref:cellulose biosynthesis protein BcsC n=1 Tax=Novosphingobium sp. TaxID=1874826 RepID=UPI002632CBED|nr:cellulose biosynthesis protein BcsC [Novosphingobium sp.]
MSAPQRTVRLGLIAALLAGAAVPSAVLAETPAVKALLDQAAFWRAKGRNDLADQALRRARALDPKAAEAAPARPKAAPVPKAPAATTPVAARAAPAPRKAAAAPVRTPANTAGTARVAGFSALDSGDLATAANRFERALAVNRNDGDALGGLGIVRLRQSRFADARDLLERASRLPGAARWADALASARFFGGIEDAREALDRGLLDKAQAIAEDTVRLGFSQPQPALELLAQIYEKQGRFADSADLYRQASAGGGADEARLASRAARGRALDAMARGDDYAAEQEFQGGLLIDRNDPWIRYEFARFMIGRGRRAEAESLVASLSQSADPDALYAAALINKDLGNLLAASALVERVPESRRNPAMRNFAVSIKIEAAIARAKALAETGQKPAAISTLRQIASLPSLPAARRADIAGALYDLGDEASASSLARSALDGEITDLGGYDALVRVLASTGRDDLARAALQKASALGGASPDAQRAVARMAAGLAISQADRMRLAGQFAPAFDLLQGAWNGAPDNPEILAALARLYQSGGMSARAAQSYQLVLVRDARNREALLGLAQTAQAAGDRDLSKDAADRALAAYPTDYQVHLTLARVAQDRGDKGAAVRLLKQARELYARQNGGTTDIAPGANPFAATAGAGDGNPFRAQGFAAPAPAAVNPFALGNSTRLPSQPATGAGFAPPGFAPQRFASAAAAAPVPQAVAQAPGGWGGASSGSFGMSAAAVAPADSGFGAGYPTGPVDPVLAAIASEIADLSEDSRPRADLQTGYRSRKGEEGLSALSEIKGTAELSTGLLGGRVRARAEAVVIDSGRPTGSALQRFGQNATIEAQAIVDEERAALVQAPTQQASGVAFSIGYADRTVQVEGGTTPVGMGETKATFRAAITPELSPGVQAKAWVERKPVTDSVLSYAGTRDPVTGQRWGQVMRTGGGAGFSYDRNGSGVYGEASYNRYNGTNVRQNTGIEANVGGYIRLIKGVRSQLTGGINANYQTYDNNQNYFTYGHGGYFSPQSFLSIGFPINYTLETDRISAKANLTPGFQSFSQDETALYPTDPALQANLDALKDLNTDVRARYDSLSRTGFAISAGGELYYKVSPNTQVGGNVSFTSFGQYEELRSLIGIRQAIGGTR